MAMEISHSEPAPGIVVIAMTGKLLMPAVGEQIVELVESELRQGKRTFVFDFSGVTALDSIPRQPARQGVSLLPDRGRGLQGLIPRLRRFWR
jgi:hypothetical protein